MVFKPYFYIAQALRRLFVFVLVLLTLSLATVSAQSNNQTMPAVQLAQVYNKQNIQLYLVSEKYDGIRAIWKDRTLRTRRGNLIHAPSWFTDDLPDTWLDGELWYQRGNFEYVASVVSKAIPIDSEWQNITFMVFDAPQHKADFRSRVISYTKLLRTLNLKHVKPVEQLTVNTNAELSALLERYTAIGAEGLMLQKADASFMDGRSGNLLKLKQYMDAEALVLAHLPGKGKYTNRLGALLVRYDDTSGNTIEFKIGSGFSDDERTNPPPIGTVVTFKYHGLTRRGVPRFASFMRVYK